MDRSAESTVHFRGDDGYVPRWLVVVAILSEDRRICCWNPSGKKLSQFKGFEAESTVIDAGRHYAG
jgi:hypothetical protein